MAHMIAREIEKERCIDTGDMTKFDGRFYLWDRTNLQNDYKCD